ncbi:MAG: Mur ligase domain-containing protein [Bacteroidales bacterium]|nr:Mur ligase domain-containing protein [Bacteroidales bacterium]
MSIKDLHSVVFLGIGGIGMSALARYLNQQKVSVSGYDRTPSPLTAEMENEGIRIWYDDDLEQLPKSIDLVIYTPAIPHQLNTLVTLQSRNIPLMKRAEFLGKLVSENDCLAVAGTHGKTTTSAILGHILYQSSVGCTAFIGGIVNNYHNNYFSSHSGPFVVEADEFDHSLLHLFPKIAAINSMDADHLDIYENQNALIETYQNFARQIAADGCLIVKKGLETKFDKSIKTWTVSLHHPDSDFHTTKLRVENGVYHFDIQTPQGIINDVVFGGVGAINVHNAVTASAMALCYGISPSDIKTQLATFAGVHRRLEFHIKTDNGAY